MENNIKAEEKYFIDLYNEKYIDLNKKIKNKIHYIHTLHVF